jgi:purine-binding chemotaxis protein CheW
VKLAATNWEEVRNRMRASEAALEQALAPTPERIEDAYRRRAVLLAAVEKQHEPISTRLPVLVCRLAEERYAIEAKDVSEVVAFERCVPVPGAPQHILGVINLRGELRAVADLGCLLNPSGAGTGGSGLVVMLRNKGHVSGSGEIGLKVDRVEALLEVTPQKSPSGGPAGGYGGFGKGLVSGALMLIDLEKVLAELIAGEERHRRPWPPRDVGEMLPRPSVVARDFEEFPVT